MYFDRQFFEETFPKMLEDFNKKFQPDSTSVRICVGEVEYYMASKLEITDRAVVFYYHPSRIRTVEVVEQERPRKKPAYPLIALPYSAITSVEIEVSHGKKIGFRL